MKIFPLVSTIFVVLLSGCWPTVSIKPDSPASPSTTQPVVAQIISTPSPTISLSTPTPILQQSTGAITGTLIAVAYQTKANDQISSTKKSNLVLVDMMSRTVTSLTNGPCEDRDPRWSYDGSEIAFSSNRGGQFDIFTVQRDRTELTQITSGPGDKYSPVWSPDGERLAYVLSKSEGKLLEYTELDVIDLKTRRITPLLHFPWQIRGPDILNVNWSPVDADQILYARSESVHPTSQKSDSQTVEYFESRVYLLNVKTGENTLLSPEGWSCANASWSPDGVAVLMNNCSPHGSDGGSFPMVGWLQKTGTYKLTKIRIIENQIPFTSISWSPDGTRWIGVSSKQDGTTFLQIYSAQFYLEAATYPLPQPYQQIYGVRESTAPIIEFEGKEIGYRQPDWSR